MPPSANKDDHPGYGAMYQFTPGVYLGYEAGIVLVQFDGIKGGRTITQRFATAETETLIATLRKLATLSKKPAPKTERDDAPKAPRAEKVDRTAAESVQSGVGPVSADSASIFD